MPLFSVDVDIDAWDIVAQLTSRDKQELVNELVESGYIANDIPLADGISQPTLLMEDPGVRLDAIAWLLANGYTAEPK